MSQATLQALWHEAKDGCMAKDQRPEVRGQRLGRDQKPEASQRQEASSRDRSQARGQRLGL